MLQRRNWNDIIRRVNSASGHAILVGPLFDNVVLIVSRATVLLQLLPCFRRILVCGDVFVIPARDPPSGQKRRENTATLLSARAIAEATQYAAALIKAPGDDEGRRKRAI